MQESNQSAFSRRDFLKTTAAAGAMGAVFTSSFVSDANAAEPAKRSEVQKIKTNCRSCTHNCGVIAHVRDGRVVKLEGNPTHPMSRGTLCAKGLSGIQALYNPNRLKYPMKRIGARGENKWQRITWDEAIDELAKKLMEYHDKYGAESLFCSTGGGGNPQFYSIARFCNAFGTPNWFEPGCSQCFLPRTASFGLMYGGPSTSIADSLCVEMYTPNAPVRTVVQWGANSSYSNPAGGGRGLAELRAKGVKTIHVDPRFTADAAKADIWLPIKPATDVAMLLCWIGYIMQNKLYDHEFTLKWTNLPYLVNTKTKMFVRENEIIEGGSPEKFVVWDNKTNRAVGLEYPWDDSLDVSLEGKVYEVNGITCRTGFDLLLERASEFSVEKASKICCVDPKKVEEAINLYARNGAGGLALGVATDQFPNSTQAAICAVILNSIMGNVEKPGALMQRFPSSGIAPFGTYMFGPSKKLLPKEQLLKRLGGIEHKGLLQWWAAHIPSIQNAVLTGKPYKPRIWIDRSGNKFNVTADANSWLKVIEELDYVVHMFLYPTSFTAYADLVLPATEWLETNCLLETMNYAHARQAVTHTWETMDETMFWAKLAKKLLDMGHENMKRAFDAEFMGNEMPYWSNMDELLDIRTQASFKMSWEEFKKVSPYEYMPMDKWHKYYLYKSIDPKTNKPRGFGTPSKKIELYGECWITLGRTGKPWTTYELPPASVDYDPLPYYMEPPEEGIKNEYPITITNGRLPVYQHGTLRNVPYIREIFPVADVWMNTDDAAKQGIKTGEWVYVESLRGKIHAKARVTEGIPPNVAYMERFWNPETVNTKTHGWKEMNYNVLTRIAPPYNDICGTYTLRGIQVKISKAPGKPEGIWEEPHEFEPWMHKPVEPTPELGRRV